MAYFRSVLVVDDEPSLRHVLTLVLREEGMDVRAVADGAEALAELKSRRYDVVLSDLRMPKVDGLTLLAEARRLDPDLTFIAMSAYGSKDLALQAVAAGAYDFIEKPFKPEEALFILRKAEERERLVRENQRLKGMGHARQRLLGSSEGMQNLQRQIDKVSATPSTVLITGESGTGKELVARAIHESSARAKASFVAVNCGAIPAGLLESELFGHARGAFTDARQSRAGVFSEADGGTLFLDEIGEFPMAAQVKLLRVLQDGEIRPVGETRSERVDVRVIAATLRDLPQRISTGDFREDLYFRLSVVQLRVPPLRERMEDLPALILEFLNRFNRAFNRDPPVAPPLEEVAQLLADYRWPGNVRELENAIEHAVVFSDGGPIVASALPERLRAAPHGDRFDLNPEAMQFSLKRSIPVLEAQFIRAALKHTAGNRTKAATLLEISPRALLYKIRGYGLDSEGVNDPG